MTGKMLLMGKMVCVDDNDGALRDASNNLRRRGGSATETGGLMHT
jgi:hypothetical protein